MSVPLSRVARLVTYFVLLLSQALGERPDVEDQLDTLEVDDDHVALGASSTAQISNSELNLLFASNSSVNQHRSEADSNLSSSRLMVVKGSAQADAQYGNSGAVRSDEGVFAPSGELASGLLSKSLVAARKNHEESTVLHIAEGSSFSEPHSLLNPKWSAPQALPPASRGAVVTGTTGAIGAAAQKEAAMETAAITFSETGSEVIATKSDSLLESSGVAAGGRRMAAKASESFKRVSRLVGNASMPWKKSDEVHSFDDHLDEVVDEAVASAIHAIRTYAGRNKGTCPKDIRNMMLDSYSIHIPMDRTYAYGVGCKVACSCPWGFVFACHDNDYYGSPHDANTAVARLFVHKLGHCEFSVVFLCGLSAVGLLLTCMICSCAGQSLRRRLSDADVVEVKLSKADGVNFRG